MDNEKKILGVSTIAVIALILIVVASTYAFFKATDATDDETPLTVTTNTTDSLVFNVDTDITMVADMSNFTEGKGNREGLANATATLKANNKTNSATGNYYLYFDIKENELTYTTEVKTAELLLQVSGPDGTLGAGDIAGLNYVTVTDGKGQSISGFDITEVGGLITITSNKEITTTSEKVDNWEIKVILVNLNEDQSSNGGKRFNGELIIQKEEIVFPKLAEFIKTEVYTGTQGENNIYYHKNLANSAEDESYRYAGSYESVNNYVCFGSDEANCPWKNMYRIIGVFGDQVKLVKADFATKDDLGETEYAEGRDVLKIDLSDYKGQLDVIQLFYHTGSFENKSNIWEDSTLNTNALNNIFFGKFNQTWQEKILIHDWIVGGNTRDLVEWGANATAPNVYYNEIISPAVATKYQSKIGLIYISDYMFAASPSYWTYSGYTYQAHPDKNGNYGEEYDYRASKSNNWLLLGVSYGVITRNSEQLDSGEYSFLIHDDGIVSMSDSWGYNAILPTFYLNSDVTIISGDGSKTSPYRIS